MSEQLWTFDKYSRTWLSLSTLKGFLALVAHELDESLRSDAEVRSAAEEYVGGIMHNVDKAAAAQRRDPLLGNNPVELRLSPFLANVEVSGVVYPDPRLIGVMLHLARDVVSGELSEHIKARTPEPDREYTLPEQAATLAYEYMLEVHRQQTDDGSSF